MVFANVFAEVEVCIRLSIFSIAAPVALIGPPALKLLRSFDVIFDLKPISFPVVELPICKVLFA